MESPPLGRWQALADAALNNPDAHLYGPVLGLPALRAEIASQWSASYGTVVTPAQVAITQGCNQAFCAVMSTLAGAGDEVTLPTPGQPQDVAGYAGRHRGPSPAGEGLIPVAASPPR